MRLLFLFGSLLVAAISVAQTQKASDVADFVSVDTPVFVLSHVRVIDGTGAPAKEDQAIVVANGEIQSIGAAASVQIPHDAQRIRPEVYVVPFQSNGVKYQASTTGGWVSRFAGNEFFFVTMGNRLMAARVVTQPNFHLEDLHPLFQLDLPNFSDPIFDVTSDGQRFVVLTADRAKTSSISLLTNWTAALNK